jgi:hypothetical protein
MLQKNVGQINGTMVWAQYLAQMAVGFLLDAQK